MSGVAHTLRGMGVQGSGEAIAKILRRLFRRILSPSRRSRVHLALGKSASHRAVPIGYVNMRSLDGRHVFDAYAHFRDDNGRRPWLRTFDTFNSAVAWMIQHEDQIRAFNDRHHPEPEQWPA